MKTGNIYDNWVKIGGEPIVDLEKYIYNQLATRSDMKIMIGTDSMLAPISKQKNKVSYLTVIVFRKGTNGCHVIKRRDEEIKHGHVPTAVKLNGEINRTAELGLFFQGINLNPEVHLDLSTNEKYGSFEVYKYIRGYFEGLGFVTKYKSDAVAASFAADYFL